ncbi:OmpA family protein [Novosphingobium sp. P6W]|uniref:OmpA family protein n=1 Tax=Novosphingobium sp. P6W TaxID=1609758 RepID=UPI0005C3138F|nr:OmpA family protein [Novosphingobium sp. P6W]AXB75321.1 OmpA family protein [Novosphingobium sp. P6W]KIS32634.1 OmpA family protein [Novosphingobium sp. P6W]
MSVISHSPRVLLMAALLAGTAAGSVSAQTQDPSDGGLAVTVSDTSPTDRSAMTEGPEVKGIISARSGAKVQVTSADGNRTVVVVDDATKISASKGLFGMGSNKLAATSLLNGLPVSIKTLQGGGTLLASEIKLQNKDLKTATMIRNGTDQGFAEQTAATEALRGRMGDIGKYNIKGTTNVNFDTGKYSLSPEAKQSLCAAASSAEGMDNALLLVVGYTDSTGNPEFNQVLSEKRAGGVVNFLQQACHWKPYRMLTPTGMSEADPLADNTTEEGKAQNRRVAVNILVSKGLDGL